MIAAACCSFMTRFVQESEGTYDSVSAVSAKTGGRPRVSGGAAASVIGNTVLDPPIVTVCACAVVGEPAKRCRDHCGRPYDTINPKPSAKLNHSYYS